MFLPSDLRVQILRAIAGRRLRLRELLAGYVGELHAGESGRK